MLHSSSSTGSPHEKLQRECVFLLFSLLLLLLFCVCVCAHACMLLMKPLPASSQHPVSRTWNKHTTHTHQGIHWLPGNRWNMHPLDLSLTWCFIVFFCYISFKIFFFWNIALMTVVVGFLMCQHFWFFSEKRKKRTNTTKYYCMMDDAPGDDDVLTCVLLRGDKKKAYVMVFLFKKTPQRCVYLCDWVYVYIHMDIYWWWYHGALSFLKCCLPVY